ncbi:MAG: NADH-quinone oxidoreductase subunit C [Thermoplasmata archaeon]|nr:MAG: NADH-quinone oxidoreductase subunit C [Thermoplasmata archaeon]
MTDAEGLADERDVTPVAIGARDLADKVRHKAVDLFTSVEPTGDHVVQAETTPDLLGDALTSLRDKVGLDELLAITVVDSTDLAEGLALVHHVSTQAGGPTLEVWTPYPEEEDGDIIAPSVPSSVSHWRAAEWLERESWEMSGVAFDGHPGLRRLLLPRWWVGHPLRRDGAGQRTMGLEDPTVTPGDEEMEVEGFVPQDLPYPAMGGRLGLVLREKEGKVTGARVSVGHLHRGVEGLLEGSTFEGAMPVVARTAVTASVHWQVAYAEAVEALCHVEVPSRGRAVRVALMELERIADHMMVHAATLEMVDCPTAASRVWTDREMVMDASQAVTGQRLVQDAIVVGGVAQDAREEWSRRLLQVARVVQRAVREYVHEAEALEPLGRLKGLAPVHLEDMTGWGLTGPVLRSAGVARDARSDGRCRTYAGREVPVQTRETGDAEARSELRILEMASSARTLAQLARDMPGGRSRSFVPESVPKGRGLGIVEAPGGEVLCMVAADGGERPRRVRLRGPDTAHAGAMADLVLGCLVEDVPLAVVSLGLNVGGCDR